MYSEGLLKISTIYNPVTLEPCCPHQLSVNLDVSLENSFVLQSLDSFLGPLLTAPQGYTWIDPLGAVELFWWRGNTLADGVDAGDVR